MGKLIRLADHLSDAVEMYGSARTTMQSVAGVATDVALSLRSLDAQHERIVAGLEARIAKQDEWLSEVMRERDWAQKCLQDTHITLGGDGEWTGKTPAEMPPDSGDLHYDVPWLAAEVMADAMRLKFLADNKLCITPIEGGGWDVYRYGDGCVESLVATATTFTGAIDRARDAFLAQTADGV